MVPGKQTIDRAELFAIAVAVSQAWKTRVISDSQYALRILEALVSGIELAVFQRAPNFDLITLLSIALKGRGRDCISWIKIESHQDLLGPVFGMDFYHVLGNHVADSEAKKQYHAVGQEVTKIIEDVARHEKEWSENFFRFCQFLCKITKRISGLNKSHVEDAKPEVDDNSYVEQLSAWQPTVTTCTFHFETPPGFESSFVYGERYMLALFAWLRSLTWPTETSPHDVGVTWLELFVDFCLSTGVPFPSCTGFHKGCPVFQRHGSAALLVENPLVDKIKHFRSSVKALCYRNNADIVPLGFAVHKCRSLMKFPGGKIGSGFSVRPTLVSQHRTVAAIEKFHNQGRSVSGYGSKLQTHISLDYGSPVLVIPQVDDTPFTARIEGWLLSRYRNCHHRARVRRLAED
eukprot:Skav216987  [mRNA]  locus=scaffold594:216399:217610:+ [translate_table: standard]